MIIRTKARQQSLSRGQQSIDKTPKKRVTTRKKSRIRPSAAILYTGAFIAIIAVVAVSNRATDSSSSSSVASVSSVRPQAPQQQTSVDEVVATTLAASVAEAANLPVANNVANLSVSLAAKNEVASTGNTESVVKQEIVQPSGDRRELVTHRAKRGDTVGSLAAEYGVSKETIRWANSLTSDAIDVNKKLVIPPVDGVVYTVKKGDTAEKLAEKYKSSEERIVAFNDLELSGFKHGDKIIIPAGKLPENERPGYVEPVQEVPSYVNQSNTSIAGSGNFMSGSVGNRYAYGYCTWYAYERRAAMGKPIGSFWGNANTWAAAARSQGFTVSSTPIPGAVFQTSFGGGGYGHVGIIESVDTAKGTVTYSDMNGGAGWNRIGRATISISQAQSQWVFIY